MRQHPTDFPREARLKGQGQFTGRFSYRLDGHWFVVLARRAGNPARLGVVASRKAVPKAVERSLGKRLVREEFRCWRPQLPQMDLVVRIKERVLKKDRIAARVELRSLIARAIE